MVRKRYLILFVAVLISISFVSAWEFNGTVKDVDGNALSNTSINLTYWVMGANSIDLVGTNSTTSNASGWFELNATENSSYMYMPIIRHTNGTTGAIDWVGQSLPQFPYQEFANMSDINFYLKEAGTLNITAINSSSDRINFHYMVKDTKLGYDVSSSFATAVSEKVIYVPKNRNYSIMIYPQDSLPVSFDWNNFSSTKDYNIDSLSSYNATTRVMQKQFNTTTSLVEVTGYIQNTSRDDFANWDEFTVIPFLLEPGNMIYMGEGGMPYNMSAWNATPYSDSYELTSGQYNITLPGPNEGADIILFASARNGSNYYGGYLNISTSYGDPTLSYNFTMYPLMGTNWGASNGNFTLNKASDWLPINISSAKQQFNFLDSTGSLLSEKNLHIEITVDYSDYGAKEITFMEDLSTGDATMNLPLLNITGLKEMNVYSMDYAPKRLSTMSVSDIRSNPNITLTRFSPGDINGGLANTDITINLYKSSSSCDVPNPGSSCSLQSSSNLGNFNPLEAIIGGGEISFRMGIAGSVEIHYVNVDMLASGPPGGLFDDNSDITESTSGGFSKAMRFGSDGPTIYDNVLISMPYTPGNSNSQSGLDESKDVNISIPYFYDTNASGTIDWNNPIWDSSSNGTNATSLAGNYSHYSGHESEWQRLIESTNCTHNVSHFNSTNPCFINKTSNKIWVRVPHFSGTKPSISASSIVYTSSDDSSSSSGSGTTVTSFWTNTFLVTDEQFEEGITNTRGEGERFKVSVDEETHYVGVINITESSAVINVSSDTQQVIMNVGEENKFELTNDNYYDLLVRLNSIENSEANLTIQAIHEEMPEEAETADEEGVDGVGEGIELSPEQSLGWVWVVVVILIGVAGYFAYYFYRKKF